MHKKGLETEVEHFPRQSRNSLIINNVPIIETQCIFGYGSLPVSNSHMTIPNE